MTTPQPDTRRHRALSTQSRVDLLEALRTAGHPLAVPEAARLVGLHPNTARVHLERLVEVGLADRHRESRDQPGRPRTLYAASLATGSSSVADGPGEGEDYKALASLLAREMGAAPDARRAAIEAGHRWARAQEGASGAAPPGDARDGGAAAGRPAGEAVAEVVRLMDELGFEPAHDADGNEILLRRCPFEEVARESRAVVCGVHLGLLEGTFDQLGAAVGVQRLEPFREDEPILCSVLLDAPDTGSAAGSEATPEEG